MVWNNYSRRGNIDRYFGTRPLQTRFNSSLHHGVPLQRQMTDRRFDKSQLKITVPDGWDTINNILDGELLTQRDEGTW
jgi:hypothetical protein